MISRRDLLKLSSLVGLVPSFPAVALDLPRPDYRIEIAPVTIEVTNRTDGGSGSGSGSGSGRI
jgi:hypothetical protein